MVPYTSEVTNVPWQSKENIRNISEIFRTMSLPFPSIYGGCSENDILMQVTLCINDSHMWFKVYVDFYFANQVNVFIGWFSILCSDTFTIYHLLRSKGLYSFKWQSVNSSGKQARWQIFRTLNCCASLCIFLLSLLLQNRGQGVINTQREPRLPGLAYKGTFLHISCPVNQLHRN